MSDMDAPNPAHAAGPAGPGVDTAALLEQLADVATPDAVAWFPPAPGWWIVAGLILLGLYFVVRFFARRRQRARYRKEARVLLEAIDQQWARDHDDHAYAIAAHQLVRRVAIHVSGRESVARLTGRDFIESVNALSVAAFSRRAGDMLSEASYRPSAEINVECLRTEVADWLSRLEGVRRA